MLLACAGTAQARRWHGPKILLACAGTALAMRRHALAMRWHGTALFAGTARFCWHALARSSFQLFKGLVFTYFFHKLAPESVSALCSALCSAFAVALHLPSASALALVLSCLLLSCLVLCLALSCLVFSCLFLSGLALSCLVLCCLVLSYPVSDLVWSCLVLSCVLPCLAVSCCVFSWRREVGIKWPFFSRL